MLWSSELQGTAIRQFGVISARQLACLGVSNRQIQLLTASGQLVRVQKGVYRCAGVAPSWRGRAMGVCLAIDESVCLSHSSAAVAWSLLDHQAFPRLDVSGPRLVRLPGVVAHRTALPAAQRTVRHGLRVTTVERTLLDLGAVMDGSRLGAVVDEALRERLTTPARLGALEEIRCRGCRTFRDVMAERGVGYDPGASAWEREMDRLWERMGLPAAERQHEVRVAGRRYIIDRAIVDLQIGVEWNGHRYHAGRARFDYDSQRRAHLAEAGWWVLDFTTRSTPDDIVRTVLAVYEKRRVR